MDLPIDTARLTLMAMGAATPVTDEQGRPRGTRDGEGLWKVPVAIGNGTKGVVVDVRLVGEPVGLVAFGPVKVTDLTVSHFSFRDSGGRERSGLSFRAAKVESAASVRNGAQGG